MELGAVEGMGVTVYPHHTVAYLGGMRVCAALAGLTCRAVADLITSARGRRARA